MPSAVVAHIDYDPGSLTLRITFTSGKVYDYLHVPASIYAAMKKSGSKGIFLNTFIKGHYPFKKLT
jgi:hypothetical protein